jgi:hypothetical protein
MDRTPATHPTDTGVEVSPARPRAKGCLRYECASLMPRAKDICAASHGSKEKGTARNRALWESETEEKKRSLYPPVLTPERVVRAFTIAS